MDYLATPDVEILIREAGFEFSRIMIAPAGQSNSTFLGAVSALTVASWAAELAAVPMTARMGDNANPPDDTDYPLQSLDSLTYLGLDRIGFAHSMMYDLNRTEPDAWALANFGYSSTSALNWDPLGTFPSATSPPNHFENWCTFIDDSLVSTECSRFIVPWEQGENDAGGLTTANNYDDAMIAMDAALADRYGRDVYLGMVVGKLNADYNGGSYTTELRASQVNFVNATPTASMVVQDSVTIVSGLYDGVHYTSDGYIEIGHLFAAGLGLALGIDIKPYAAFDVSQASLVIDFTDTSYGVGATIVGWSWTFGDSGTSTSQNPQHTYASPGPYTVTCTITDSNGSTDLYTDNIDVTEINWSVDSGSNKGLPNGTTEWAAMIEDESLTINPPSSVHLFQGSGSPHVDAINTAFNLTASGAGFLYQQAVTGWTALCTKLTDGTAGNWRTTNAALPNILTESCALLVYLDFPAGTPAATRILFYLGSSVTAAVRFNSGTPRLSTASGVAGTATDTVDPRSTQVPCLLVVNRTTGAQIAYTNTAKLVPAWSSTLTGESVTIGSNASAAGVGYIYDARWDGADAELFDDTSAKAMLESLGWTVTGY